MANTLFPQTPKHHPILQLSTSKRIHIRDDQRCKKSRPTKTSSHRPAEARTRSQTIVEGKRHPTAKEKSASTHSHITQAQSPTTTRILRPRTTKRANGKQKMARDIPRTAHHHWERQQSNRRQQDDPSPVSPRTNNNNNTRGDHASTCLILLTMYM